MAVPHPLDPLTPQEISLATGIVRNHFPKVKLVFRAITLSEPPKKELVPFLEAERLGNPHPYQLPRVAQVLVYLGEATQFRRVQVNLTEEKVSEVKNLSGSHAYVDAGEMVKCEKACLEDPRVQAAIKALQLPDGAEVVCDPWTYSPDGMNDMSRRCVMCFFYMKLSDHGDANHYAYPLEFVAELSDELKVMKVLKVPAGADDRMEEVDGNLRPFDRSKIHTTSEYHPDLMHERRNTVKPLNVVQPQGPSFHCIGNLVNWQKWRFRVGFNYREGLVIHDVTYDGRQVFHRLSLSEMFVPYGDPRAPYPRKAAFDFGNNGGGVTANNLGLGCDCLGHIKYFDFWHHTNDGVPVKMPNVICCHEIDDGILWKHTNYRTNHAVVARSRVLVLQTIITVSNYEYIFAFHFNQAAEITYEVRATGILSTAFIDIGASVPYGTVVAPGVMAPYHQHLFSLRIDPAIDGHENSLVVEESRAMMVEDPASMTNVGYVTTKEFVETEGPLDTDNRSGRVFKIVNEHVTNPVTGTPVGYKLVPHYSQMLLAHPSSYHSIRSEFAAHPIWVTRHHDSELFAAGEHTLQSEVGSGIATWIKSRQSALPVRNEDIVVWHTFGTTHNPRIEEWPVMPVEKMMVTLKPVNFFTRNPALDVPISNQADNKSVLVTDGAESGAGCCSG
ncbi:amine oxidase [Coniochaeta ligniaria NRRL 30616]|uniref:Amine oxidase n=1 Tax=Coniochaeta ligniaria NRRL 30616 TaxID=1408157 RepID=A0A1J7JAX0_9PEZI|nr:amine oxidase [Coniochaeta ligniaria NRRL 30616]